MAAATRAPATPARRVVVAVDLEGTLISNAVSVFPRPGLHPFLAELAALADSVVVYTAVAEARARDVAALLAAEGSAPAWFADVPIVVATGPKDLSRVADLAAATVLLVDDRAEAVAAGQQAHWVPVAPFEPPYAHDDGELAAVLARVRARI